MRHRLKHHLFDREKSCQKARIPSTFTTSKNPHLTKHKLHSKSTYFYRWGSRINYVVPSMCALALLFGGIIAISPLLHDNPVYADTDSGGWTDDNTDTTPKISLDIAPNTTDSTNGNVTIGEPAYFSNTITVGGSNITNYSLTLNTTNSTNGDLVGESNAYATVGKVGSNTSPTAFPDNTWGYAISTVNTNPDKASLSYNPVPGTESNNSAFLDYQKNLSGAVNNTYKLVFAAKLGNTMPSDHYQANVYLSAVASATETVENWFLNAGITTMQQMNSTICKSAPENATSQLRDERDGKLYWVTKLKDNNCWMTQNLDYDGGGTPMPIENWTAENVTSTTAAYYDPGTYYYNGPSGNHLQGSACTEEGTTGVTSTLSSCTDFSTTGLDSHYIVGNYYSWPAAINNVCPNGWILPPSKSPYDKSFQKLLNAYGIQYNTDASVLSQAPLHLVYSGKLISSQIMIAGSSGWYWSSTPYETNTSYRFQFSSRAYPDDTSSSNYVNRDEGLSVRCVAE